MLDEEAKAFQFVKKSIVKMSRSEFGGLRIGYGW